MADGRATGPGPGFFGHQAVKRGAGTGDYVGPVADFVMVQQLQGGIPRVFVAPVEPAPPGRNRSRLSIGGLVISLADDTPGFAFGARQAERANKMNFRAGADSGIDRIGDRLFALSTEITIPIDFPYSIGTTGIKFFYDTATAYNFDQSIYDMRFLKGLGGGIFLAAPFGAQLRLDAAHTLSGSLRFHAGLDVSF